MTTVPTLFTQHGEPDTGMGDVLGIIGERQLVAVQLFDIARHTTHPVAIVPSSFVAVTGRGPRDSNESGKTSFNAAVSLLLGDPEWRAASGGAATVAQLLFEPNTAGVTATRYPAALHGFIVGVFAEPDDVAGTAHTVWMKISSTPKYVRVRHQPGVQLVDTGTQNERHEQAKAIWESLPAPEYGAGSYVEKLYGRSPRCLAYVASRGNQRSGPSLLKMDTGAFKPEDIGAALIRLTGRSEALELEKDQRRKLADQIALVEATKLGNAEKFAAEEEILDGVRTRETVRAKLGQGDLLWRKHLARGLLDGLAREDWLKAQIAGIDDDLKRELARLTELRAKEKELQDLRALKEKARTAEEAFQLAETGVADAQRAETRLTTKIAIHLERMNELERRGARDAKLSVPEAEDQLRRHREAHTAAVVVETKAREKVEGLREELERAELGASGSAAAALAALAGQGVEAVGLMDAIEVAADHRAVWEPRLHPWRAAVCVTEGKQTREAIAALAGVPGAIVVAGPAVSGPSMPTGLVTAPNQALAFLTELADRTHPVEIDGVSAMRDPLLGVTVLAGFPRPTTGRAHIIRSLRDQLAEAEVARATAENATGIAERVERESETALASARAAAEHRELAAEKHRIETELLPAAQDEVERRMNAKEPALAAHMAAAADLRNARSALVLAEAARRKCEEGITASKIEQADLRRLLDAMQLSYWFTEFGADEAAARVLLNWSDDPYDYDSDTRVCRPPGARDATAPMEKLDQNTLSNRANDYLVEILADLRVNRHTGEGSPTPMISESLQRKEKLGKSESSGRDNGYAGVAAALHDWLTQLVERDMLATEQITSARADREREMNYAESTLSTMEESLSNVQDSLERRIEANLVAISEALDKLNRSAPDGYGAELHFEVDRPAGPEDPWIWSVVPKWRRSPNGRMLPYNNATNSAQEKLFSIHLVLAALLASPNPRGRVLILDELGDSLGEEHRRDVLAAVASVAEKYGITVLGTCQDAVMPDAAAFCREILYFCYPSRAEALNLPTRMFGFDSNTERVELTAESLLAGRPLV
ncbi:hypothetical protein LFM09_33700 [Lentzea alba]|uniref:hypothetical protein n=1 Tax=Lentzea alba TaxID=2714351 RepID=UPI0039BEFF45